MGLRHAAILFMCSLLFAAGLIPVFSCRSSDYMGKTRQGIVVAPRLRAEKIKAPNQVSLKVAARLEEDAVPECSGIFLSRKQKNLCWAIGDSGNGPWLYRFYFTVTADDRIGLSPVEKVRVNFNNNDWEDLAGDNQGNLIIADFGNNFSLRKNLSLLRIPEPAAMNDPLVGKKISFYYKEQAEKVTTGFAFDAEALFSFKGRLYLFTKRRKDKMTALYRFDSVDEKSEVAPTLLGYLNIGGLVTAADCLPEERLVVLLTYKSIWLLQAEKGDFFLTGRLWRLPIRAGQCEGVTFLDRQRILISNESGELFLVRRQLFKEIKDVSISSP